MVLLSEQAQEVLDRVLALLEREPDGVMSLVIPYGLTPAKRRDLIDQHQAIADELRAAGWPIEVRADRMADGETLSIGLKPGAPRPNAA